MAAIEQFIAGRELPQDNRRKLSGQTFQSIQTVGDSMQGGLRYRLGFLLVAGGLGLCGYAGLQWYERPQYSEDDLKASTELNLQVDLAKRDKQTPLALEQLENLRKLERAEIEGELQARTVSTMSWLAGGLALLVLATGQILMLLINKNG